MPDLATIPTISEKPASTVKKVIPTLRQKKAFKEIVDNGGSIVKDVMLKVGYSPATAKTPQKLTESEGWKALLEAALPDDLLAKTHLAGLHATKPILSHTEPDTEAPDYAVRHKYLETAYKLKGRLTDKTQLDSRIEIVLSRSSDVTPIEGVTLPDNPVTLKDK